LLNLILGIITTTTIEALMIYYYGLPQGAFYALFLSGSNVVAYWFIVHLLSDFGLTSFYYKTKILFKNIRSILVAIVAPIGATVVFLYSFYMGYSSLPEPYFGGFLFRNSVINIQCDIRSNITKKRSKVGVIYN